MGLKRGHPIYFLGPLFIYILQNIIKGTENHEDNIEKKNYYRPIIVFGPGPQIIYPACSQWPFKQELPAIQTRCDNFSALFGPSMSIFNNDCFFKAYLLQTVK